LCINGVPRINTGYHNTTHSNDFLKVKEELEQISKRTKKILRKQEQLADEPYTLVKFVSQNK
jgi:hypothetical protein